MEAWLSKVADIPPEIVLAELNATQRELEDNQAGLKCTTEPIEDERYEFIEEIARGGAAVVWRVRDRHLGRETAVKYLLDSQDNQDMRARLEREARLCARLVHPGIVPIHELSSFADQRPFVSMKLVEGKTLLQLLESDPPPSLKSTLETFTKACQAMAYAHEKGIIHRDLKPGNIMVGAFGEVQIMDWGLAKDMTDHIDRLDEKSSEAADEQSQSSTDKNADTLIAPIQSEATLVGSVFGTIAYMSPEQANGQTVIIDKWSDVFSLGAVLCRLLTGIPPYQDSEKSLDQETMLLRAQRADLKPAFERLARAKPRKLANLATRCMAVRPNARPADAGEIVRELEEIRKATLRTTFALRFISVAACILLIVTGSFIWAGRNQKVTESVSVVEVPAPVLSSFTFRELVQEKVSLDTEAVKVLLNSHRKEVVLNNYRTILDKNPTDEELFFLIEMALMNAERWSEGEEVARDLIKMNPGKADYHFFVSESLFWRGKYEEAKTVMLHSKALRDGGSAAQFPIDKNLIRLDKYIEIIQQVSSESPPTFDSLSSEELIEVANACGQVDKFELANGYYKRALAIKSDVYQQTYLRSTLLFQYVRKNLRRKELKDDEFRTLSALCREWIQEQLDSVSKLDTLQATQLIGFLRAPEFDFARKLVDDERIQPETRDGLKKLFKSIEETKVELKAPEKVETT